MRLLLSKVGIQTWTGVSSYMLNYRICKWYIHKFREYKKKKKLLLQHVVLQNATTSRKCIFVLTCAKTYIRHDSLSVQCAPHILGDTLFLCKQCSFNTLSTARTWAGRNSQHSADVNNDWGDSNKHLCKLMQYKQSDAFVCLTCSFNSSFQVLVKKVLRRIVQWG